jgi:RNA polymerase sigma-70 factor (ECF subfamily)
VSVLDDLFRLHAADVLAYALRRTDPVSAEDVVSEVFLIAGRRLDRIPEREPQLWLYAVARRVLANDRRGARRRLALTTVLGHLQRGPAEELAPPDSPLLAALAAADSPLLAALAALRPADREVLMLTAWEGLDAPAAGVALGCSAHAVHTRLHRARARLQAELARRGQSADPSAHSEVPR